MTLQLEDLEKIEEFNDIADQEEEEEDLKTYYISKDSDENSLSNLNNQQMEPGISEKESLLSNKRKSSISLEEEFYGFECDEDVESGNVFGKKMKRDSQGSSKVTPKKEDVTETKKVEEIKGKKEINIETSTHTTNLDNKEMYNKSAEQCSEPKTNTAENLDEEKKKFISSLQSPNEIYRRPLELGWKREVVSRAMPANSRDKGEIYYISPSGKKCRTKSEISQFLSHGLTIDCFSFSREPLGFENEIVRKASSKHEAASQYHSSRRLTSTPPVPVDLGKRIPKPKAPKGASPPPQGWTPAKAVKSISPRASGYSKSVEDAIESKSKSSSKQVKQSKKGETCTIQCPLAMGKIPQLKCRKCLCLYHHECVGYEQTAGSFSSVTGIDVPVYICRFCRNSVTSSTVLSSSTSTITQSSGIQNPPKESNIESASSSANIANVDENAMTKKIFENLKETNQNPQPLPTPSIMATNIESSNRIEKTLAKSSTPPSAQISIPASEQDLVDKNRSIDNPIMSSVNTEISSTLPQSIAVIKGRKYVVIRKSGLSSTENQSNFIDIAGDESAQMDHTPNITGDDTPIRKKIVNSRHKMHDIQQPTSSLIRAPTQNFVANFFGNISLGYDILLHIFQYLKVQELLRCACVCRLWNAVANHRSLWRTVRMKNSQISNWTNLSTILQRNGTVHLDLRKMLESPNGDDMWISFSTNIQKVTTLEIIDMCRCNAKVVENLFLTNPNLRILNANTINDSISLENLCKMQNLQELRLKSIDGISLLSDLSSLKSKFMKNLKHLALTSFSDLGKKNIEVLGELTTLESLELGDCMEFDLNFVQNVLLKLTKLERLRLEKGQESCPNLQILEAVAKLPNLTHLELINFDVRTGFDEKLSNCKNLKKLLLIPTYVSQSASSIHITLNALLQMSSTLEKLTWAVTLELLKVTALYVDKNDNDNANAKIYAESVPIMKPVPGDSNNEVEDDMRDGIRKIIVEAQSQFIEILPLSQVEKILLRRMPNTKVKIVKIPYQKTWRFVDNH